MSTPKSILTDWTNLAAWNADELARTPDLWSVGNTSKPSDIAKLSGQKLVQFHHGYLGTDAMSPIGDYATALALAVQPFGAVTPYSFTVPPDPPEWIIDFARRGVPGAVAKVVLDFFGSVAQGSHVDPWSDLWWLPIFGGGTTPTGEDPATYWPKYRQGLVATFQIIRQSVPDWIVLGQDTHLSGDGNFNEPPNGLFAEQYPTFNGATFDTHALDRSMLDTLWRIGKTNRQPVWVLELRDLSKLTPSYTDFVANWCAQHDFYLSLGRGAEAKIYGT